MGDYGTIGIIGGYSRVNSDNFGKIGAEYSFQKSFDTNPDIGYKLACNANALVGKHVGFSGGVYAGLDFAKTDCTQYNVGLMADYTNTRKNIHRLFNGQGEALSTNNCEKLLNDKNALSNNGINPNQIINAGAEVGFTRNLCCDEDRKLHIAMQGGAEFTAKPELNTNNDIPQIVYKNKFNQVAPFIGAKIEYSTAINNKGNELFFRGNCNLSEQNTKGEIGVGFRF